MPRHWVEDIHGPVGRRSRKVSHRRTPTPQSREMEGKGIGFRGGRACLPGTCQVRLEPPGTRGIRRKPKLSLLLEVVESS